MEAFSGESASDGLMRTPKASDPMTDPTQGHTMSSWIGGNRSQQWIAIAFVAVIFTALLQIGSRADLGFWVIGSVCLMVSALLLLLFRSEARPGFGSPPAFSEGSPKTFWGAFGIVAGLALLLRLHTLLLRPTWADEMWTLRNVYGGDFSSVLRIAAEDYWPPLHYFLLNAAARIGDTGLFTLRFPSVLFGVGTIILMPYLGRELFKSRNVGLVSGLFLTVMTAHVLYSQEARVYSMLVFLASLSALFFFRSLWLGRVSIPFIASTTLLCYSHSFSTLFFLSSIWTFLLLVALFHKPRKILWPALASQVIIFVLVLPLLGLFLKVRLQNDISVPTEWATGLVGTPTLFSVVEEYQGLSVRSWVNAAFQALLFLLALLALWGPRGQRDRNSGDSGNLPKWFHPGLVFVICWVVVPILVSLLTTAFTPLKTLGAIRYHLTVLPGMCLLAGGGFLLIRSRVVFGTGVAAILLIGALELPRYYEEYDHPALDEAATFVKARSQPGESIFLGNAFRAFAYYYRGEYPRIGTDEWREFEATYAGYSDRFTDESGRFASRYSVEKLPPHIHWVRYSPPPMTPPHLRDYGAFWDEAKNTGIISGSFWLVHAPGEKGMVEQLESVGLSCAQAEIWHFQQVEVRYCTP